MHKVSKLGRAMSSCAIKIMPGMRHLESLDIENLQHHSDIAYLRVITVSNITFGLP